MHKLIYTQLVITVAVALAAFFYSEDLLIAAAGLYGGAIALVNSLLLVRRVSRGQARNDDPEGTDFVRSLYISAVQRFVLAMVAMAVGMGMLALNPPVLLIAFALCQVAFTVAGPKAQMG